MPSAHVGQAAQFGPPQSTPVSFWFWMPSEHVGQAAQFGPPQSTKVSPWFNTPSTQLAAWHTLVVQTKLVQSAIVVQG